MGYSSAQAKAFINEIGPFIAKYALANGYHVASPIVAQAVCESGVTSPLAVKYHNYFGLKAGSSTKGSQGVWDGTVVKLSTKEEYTPGTLTNIKDHFRVYKNMEEGVKGYFEFLCYPRYLNLKTCRTPREFLETIKKDGYCTSSTYVNTNLSIIDKYDLYRFDKVFGNPVVQQASDKSIDAIAKEVIAGVWGSGVERQAKLTAAGFNYAEVQNRVNEMLSK